MSTILATGENIGGRDVVIVEGKMYTNYEIDYHTKNVSLYQMDCMELLRQTPNKYYDVIFADAPYFDGPNKREFYGKKVSSIGVKRIYKKINSWNKPDESLFNEIIRCSKYYVFWGCNYFNFPFHTGRIVWDKYNDSSDYSDCEIAATNLFEHVRLLRFMWNGMLQGKSMDEGHIQQGNKKLNEKRIHQTQKPILMQAALLKKWIKPGLKLCNLHAGSFGFEIACEKMGYSITSCDIDRDVFCRGVDRFKKEISQPLFDLLETA